MKKFILIIFTTFTLVVSSQAGWFSNHDAEQKEEERREYAEQQLAQEQHINRDLIGAVIVLGIGSVILLVIGTAIGSKTRRDRKEGA